MSERSHRIASQVNRLLGSPAVSFRKASGGYTPAARWIVELADGRSVFLKLGTSDDTAAWLRDECFVYERLHGNFLPRLLGFAEGEDGPLLVLEDLSQAGRPPPWSSARVDAVLRALSDLHSQTAPLRPYDEVHGSRFLGWGAVAEDSQPLVALGLVSEKWLESALPVLVAEEKRSETRGVSPVHLDVRSDNLFLSGRGAVLVDWNHACLSNPLLDVGFWLPSLRAEGGPKPDEILCNASQLAAWVSGFFAARAGLPPVPQAPLVRQVQRQQLGPALAWAIRALGLPPLDGERAATADSA
jgi:Phosphotransferase enzyme family